MKTAKPFDNHEPAPRSTKPEGPTTGIHVRRIVNEYHPVDITLVEGSGVTFGQIIDEMIGENLRQGNRIDSFEIVITDEDWWRLQHK